MIDDLARALRLDLEAAPPELALVGAGGKTTALFQLGRRLLDAPYTYATVFLTASTHLGVDQVARADAHFSVHSSADILALERDLSTGLVAVTGPVQMERDGRQRTSGLEAETLNHLHRLAVNRGLPVLVEADGARQRPLKAPAAHEPPIPPWARTVVVVAGLQGLGKRINSGSVHRPERFSALSGLAPEDAVTPAALARVLLHLEGGRKNIPPGARRAVLLNGADTEERQAQGNWLAAQLLPTFDAVLIGNLNGAAKNTSPASLSAIHEPAAGVVLAAGGSLRLGQPKQLLAWHGQPLVRRTVQTALSAGLSPVIVVTGAYSTEVTAALKGLPVEVHYNKNWQAGQSTSLASGVRALPANAGSATFLLCDQPRVTPTLIRGLIELHATTLAPIAAPLVDGQRANPVLFDRRTFADLLSVRGDVGGRPLFARYQAAWLTWHDAHVLLDVDTPEDYAQLQELD